MLPPAWRDQSRAPAAASPMPAISTSPSPSPSAGWSRSSQRMSRRLRVCCRSSRSSASPSMRMFRSARPCSPLPSILSRLDAGPAMVTSTGSETAPGCNAARRTRACPEAGPATGSEANSKPSMNPICGVCAAIRLPLKPARDFAACGSWASSALAAFSTGASRAVAARESDMVGGFRPARRPVSGQHARRRFHP